MTFTEKRRAFWTSLFRAVVCLTLAVGSVRLATAAPLASRVAIGPRTALDRYVALPDTNFQHRVVETIHGEGVTTFIVELTSQAWLTTNEVNHPLWKHWLTIVKPDSAAQRAALLVVSGGDRARKAPTKANTVSIMIAKATASVVADLSGIPNQPLVFAGTTNRVKEDDLIAYSWEQFLKTGDERWPARLPMTKATVRAMDTITAILASPAGGSARVDQFFVMGASKRGWTTWTTAAVDDRVIGIAPAVIDTLNLGASLQHHYGVYGFFAPAVGSYTNRHLMDWAGTPEFKELARIEDPYEYRDRLTLPKFVITASGDQFFPTDSARHYFKDLSGPKYLRIVPNANHSLNGMDSWMSILACYNATLKKAPLPEFQWKMEADGAVRVNAKTAPSDVRIWQATNEKARDFRIESLGPVWSDTALKPEPDGSYLARVEKPPQGWRAFFVELTFTTDGPAPFKFTTEAFVLPDTLPFQFTPPKPAPTRTQAGKTGS
ncbi:MAG: PhoPQ-activated pathogenicity-related family protein [Verrucomicrobia bacterium]|nr:PhoPQ-activated pathogenicity-related family protein [Verrucomicrobiota bacterium]MBI3869725.1 PhoPQ-activated pathogenicity-related family protein [Verrucomicrobiota bacterium]